MGRLALVGATVTCESRTTQVPWCCNYRGTTMAKKAPTIMDSVEEFLMGKPKKKKTAKKSKAKKATKKSAKAKTAKKSKKAKKAKKKSKR
jgi:hypothetical protein